MDRNLIGANTFIPAGAGCSRFFQDSPLQPHVFCIFPLKDGARYHITILWHALALCINYPMRGNRQISMHTHTILRIDVWWLVKDAKLLNNKYNWRDYQEIDEAFTWSVSPLKESGRKNMQICEIGPRFGINSTDWIYITFPVGARCKEEVECVERRVSI